MPRGTIRRDRRDQKFFAKCRGASDPDRDYIEINRASWSSAAKRRTLWETLPKSRTPLGAAEGARDRSPIVTSPTNCPSMLDFMVALRSRSESPLQRVTNAGQGRKDHALGMRSKGVYPALFQLRQAALRVGWTAPSDVRRRGCSLVARRDKVPQVMQLHGRSWLDQAKSKPSGSPDRYYYRLRHDASDAVASLGYYWGRTRQAVRCLGNNEETSLIIDAYTSLAPRSFLSR